MTRNLTRAFRRICFRWELVSPLWQVIVQGLVIGSVILIAGALAMRPTLSVYRQWRDANRLEFAITAQADGRIAEARQAAIQLLRDAPALREEVVPVIVRTSSHLHDGATIRYALELLRGAWGTADDQLAAWVLVCQGAPMWDVLVAWRTFQDDHQAEAAYAAPLVSRLVREDLHSEAGGLLAKHSAALDRPLRLAQARLWLAQGDAASLAMLNPELPELLGRVPFAPEVVAFFGEIPQEALDPAAARQATAAIRKQGAAGATPEETLLLARLEMAARPEDGAAVLDAMVAAYATEEPLALARWCLQVDRPDVAWDLAAKAAPKDPKAHRIACEAAERNGDQARWTKLLMTPPAGADQVVIQCDLAFLAPVVRERSVRLQAEAAALVAAADSQDPGAFIALAKRAEWRGLESLSRQAWQRAIKARQGPLPFAKRLEPLVLHLAQTRSEGELFDVLSGLRQLEPGNRLVRIQHDYLACVLGKTTPAALVRDLQPIHEIAPDIQAVRFALALGFLLDSRVTEALELTRAASETAYAGNPPFQAIHGAALLAAGQREEAAVWLDHLDWDKLLPSERTCLKGLVARHTE